MENINHNHYISSFSEGTSGETASSSNITSNITAGPEQIDPQRIPQNTIINSKNKITAIRINKSTAKQLKQIVTKINKMPLGKPVKSDDVIAKSLSLLTDEAIHDLKSSTYSGQDLLELEHRKFCKTNPPITMDEFIRRSLTLSLHP